MTNANFGSRLALRPDVVATVVEEGAVLLDLESKFFYSVNASGWAVVQKLEIGATREELRAACQQWGASESDLGPIETFLGALEKDSLIRADTIDGGAEEIEFTGPWSAPMVEKHREPLHKVMTSAFDPSLPLAE